MKFALSLAAIFAVLCLASALENNPGRRVKRSKLGILYELRAKRSPDEGYYGGLRANPPVDLPTKPLLPTKGEYVCGDKICKLEPGVIPKGCNGMCQYPLKTMLYTPPKNPNERN